VPPEQRSQPDSPLVPALAVLPAPFAAEPQESLPFEVVEGRIEELGVQPAARFGAGQIETDGHVVLQKLPRGEPLLRNEGVGVEPLAENGRGVPEDFGGALLLPEGGRCADAAQVSGRNIKPRFQPPEQAREVGPLRAVERVQLVHHQVLQSVGRVVAPQLPVGGAEQQKIQHLVVGQQDIRRILPQGVAACDHLVPLHGLDRLVERVLRVVPDVQPGGHPLLQLRIVPYRPRGALRLVRRQGVHRVDEDRLDPPAPPVLQAVVEHGPEEALRLSRARSRGDHRGPSPRVRHAGEGLLLMQIRRVPERDFREELALPLSGAEGQSQKDEWAAEKAVFPPEELLEHPIEKWGRYGKSGPDVVFDAPAHFPGEY